jgi:electron transport complex protein RnfB
LSENDGYDVMMERLGFPGSTRLRPILEAIATPDQARVVAALPGTAQEVGEKTGFDIGQVTADLDALFFKGIVFPKGDFHKREFYRFARDITQFHDATMATAKLDIDKDRPLCQLWHDFKMNEMYPYYAKRDKERGQPFLRIVPAYKAIRDLAGVLPCENYEQIIKNQERLATVPCPCRLETTSLGEPCSIHDEVTHWTCLQAGRAADYVITRGSGKELSLEEALALNEVMEESGLLHLAINTSAEAVLRPFCNCCPDCCETCVSLDQAGLPITLTWEKSRYLVRVNLDDCSGCQDCIDRCGFGAIEMAKTEGSKKLKAVVDPEKCYGCGACVLGCQPEALKMKAVRPPDYIPSPD